MTSTTYYFAQPTQIRHQYLRPRLLTQLQTFGSDGRLREAIDFTRVSWWAAWISAPICYFLNPRNLSPSYVLMKDDTRSEGDAVACGFIVHPRCGKAGDINTNVELCCDDLLMKLFVHGDDVYQFLSSGSQTMAWTWARKTKVNIPLLGHITLDRRTSEQAD